MRLFAAFLIALGLVVSAAAAAPVDDGVRYLESRQQPDGGFAEPGRASDPSLTAWAVLGLVAAGSPPERAAGYLADKPYPTATDLELRILALAALGRDVSPLADRLERLRRPDGAIGPLVNSTIWGIIALRAAGRAPGDRAVAYLKAAQARDGGWSWSAGGQPDTDDTAAAVQALRAARGASSCSCDQARAGVPARPAGARRRLRAHARRRVERSVDFLGDPGVSRRGSRPGASRLRLPRPGAAHGRKLPLQREIRDHAGVGDLVRGHGARPTLLPAAAVKAVVSWSGGKDSCLALVRATAAGIEPSVLLTMMTEDGVRSRSHGLRLELVQAQAAALGLPLVTPAATWNSYEETFAATLVELRAGGIEAGVFGDIDLEPNRAWVARLCAGAGIRPLQPLWARPRRELIDELLAAGVEAVVVATRDGVVPVALLGRTLDAALADELERLGIDASGELGEYHTAVVDAPGFAHRLDVEQGIRVLRDGVWFLDLDVQMPRVYSPA